MVSCSPRYLTMLVVLGHLLEALNIDVFAKIQLFQLMLAELTTVSNPIHKTKVTDSIAHLFPNLNMLASVQQGS